MSRVDKALRKAALQSATADAWERDDREDRIERDDRGEVGSTSVAADVPWKLHEVVEPDADDQLRLEQAQATTPQLDGPRSHLVALVRRVFLPEPVGAGLRSVLYCAADGGDELTRTGRACAHVLAAQTTKRVCLLDTSSGLRGSPEREAAQGARSSIPSPRRLSGNLWIAGSAEAVAAMSVDAVTVQMRELCARFDHVIVCSSGMNGNAEPSVLASLVDGVILVVDEDRTRRDAARHTAAALEAAGARLVGVVLANQRHPIPAAIYQRL